MSKFIYLFIFLSVLLSACSNEQDDNQVAVVSAGELIVKKNCKVCHAQGINGAPIIGNRKMWQPRLQQGEDVLVEHAINGYGLMPAKGGKTELTNDEVRLAVQYFISQVQ